MAQIIKINEYQLKKRKILQGQERIDHFNRIIQSIRKHGKKASEMIRILEQRRDMVK